MRPWFISLALPLLGACSFDATGNSAPTANRAKHTKGTNRKITFAPDARKLLDEYAYPGNVRQLESALERSILLCEDDRVTLEDLPPEMTQSGGRTAASTAASGDLFALPTEGVNFEDVERSLIMQAMERTDNNIPNRQSCSD